MAAKYSGKSGGLDSSSGTNIEINRVLNTGNWESGGPAEESLPPRNNPIPTSTNQPIRSDDEKIQQELNDLYTSAEEQWAERSALWAQYYNSQNKVQQITDMLERRQAQLSDAQITNLQYQLREARSTMGNDLADAQSAQHRYDETNQRITDLESGLNVAENRQRNRI